jgi:apolipoprotein N-acyltransferase
VPSLPPRSALVVPAAVVGGVLAYSAFPSLSWWWAAPVAVALLQAAVRDARPRAALGLGLLFGLAFLLPLLRWTSLQVGPLPWLALVVAESLFLALLGLLLSWTGRLPRPALRVLAGAGALVATEALQARLPFGGFGWSRLAFTQTEAPTLGLAAVGGAPLVSFAVAVAGLALVELVLATVRRRAVPAVLAGAAAAAALVVGTVVPTPTAAEAGELAVAGVQGDVPQLGMEFNAERRAVLDNHARGTRSLAEAVEDGSAEQPDLVVWPENASDIDPFRNDDARQVIDGAVEAVDAPTLVGTLVRGEDGRTRNTSLLWLPGEGPVAEYVKRQPVPFAEYVPYRDFFRRITPLVDQAGNFAPGDEVGLLDVEVDGRDEPVRVGDLICFEVVDDDLVREVLDGGAQLLVVQTNNATFGLSDESVQQLAMTRLRAVETGRAVVHVSTVGVSAMVAPDGTLLERSTLSSAAVLHARLPLRTTPTLADRLGAGPETVLAVGGILGALVGARGRRRDGGAAPAARADTTSEDEESP